MWVVRPENVEKICINHSAIIKLLSMYFVLASAIGRSLPVMFTMTLCISMKTLAIRINCCVAEVGLTWCLNRKQGRSRNVVSSLKL